MTNGSDSLQLPYGNRRRSVSFSEIIRLEGQGNYTRIYFQDGSSLLVALTIKRLLTRLPEASFLRLHRKHVVNRAFVLGINLRQHAVRLQTGEQVSIAHRKIAEVRLAINTACSKTENRCEG